MSIEQIHNYYERLVIDEVIRRARELSGVTADMVADMACVALNRLPARYVRHDVDLVFYLTSAERAQSEQAIDAAVSLAIEFVMARSAEEAASQEPPQTPEPDAESA